MVSQMILVKAGGFLTKVKELQIRIHFQERDGLIKSVKRRRELLTTQEKT